MVKKGGIPWNKGKKGCFTEGTISKLRCRIPWNKGKKTGQTPWDKGKTFSIEHKEKLSAARIGKEPWNKGIKGSIRGWSKGLTKETDERVRRVAELKIGVQRSPETADKVSKSLTGKYRGEKSPHWKGGISYLPYCSKFNNELKEKVRERDNRTCQLCNTKENGRKLAVHHIHYDKENCHPDLIALCFRCNSKANHNRLYFEQLFMNKLNDRELLLWRQNE